MLSKIYRKSTINTLNRKFKVLGKKIDVNRFMNFRILISLSIFVLFMLLSDNGYFYGPVLSVLCYLSFEWYIDFKIKKRKDKLNYEAIFYFQVLILTLESGKNLQVGIELTSKTIDSEISDEFKKTLNEIKLGKSMNEAIDNMRGRIPSEEINTVLLNITQSSLFGNNIIDSLNNQIDYLRDKKMLSIKSKINKMPIKISVVSVVFIVPIVMLLVLGPVVINYLLKI